MSGKLLWHIGFIAALVGAMLTASASAVSIPIGNYSFEDPILANGVENRPATAVRIWYVGGSGPSGNPAYYDIRNPYGLDAPDSNPNGFYGASGNGTPQGADEANILSFSMINPLNLGATGLATNFLLDYTLQPGLYKFTAAVGARTDVDPADIFGVSFGTDDKTGSEPDTLLSTYSGVGSELTPGVFVDRSTVLIVTPDNPHIGEMLKLTLMAASTTTTETRWCGFDNARLEYRTTPYTLPGDADYSFTVDEVDAAILAENWLSGPNATWLMGDFNDDGIVDDSDAAMMAANWGLTLEDTASSAAVPESSMLICLLGLGAALLVMKRKM